MDVVTVNRLEKLEDEMSKMKISMAVAQSDIKGIKADIGAIKDDTKWVRRAITNAIIGSIIAGVIGLVFAAIKLGGGV